MMQLDNRYMLCITANTVRINRLPVLFFLNTLYAAAIVACIMRHENYFPNGMFDNLETLLF